MGIEDAKQEIRDEIARLEYALAVLEGRAGPTKRPPRVGDGGAGEIDGDKFMSATEVAELCDVTAGHIRREARNGNLPSHRPDGARMTMFLQSEVEKWARSNQRYLRFKKKGEN
jgi:excisionase family DNA binding protein